MTELRTFRTFIKLRSTCANGPYRSLIGCQHAATQLSHTCRSSIPQHFGWVADKPHGLSIERRLTHSRQMNFLKNATLICFAPSLGHRSLPALLKVEIALSQ